MSETDDTDVLLIIPPNFFSVKSSDSEDSFLNSSRTVVQKPVSCTAQVLDKLVNQVHSLESRLEGLEIDSSLNASAQSQICNTWNNKSIDSRSVGRNYFTFPRRRRRKIKKSDRSDRDDLSNLGWGETELKYNRYNISNSLERLINDTQSMDGDISSIISTPSKNNDKLLLNEIDEFLTKVESNESPESMLTREGTISPDEVIKATGDYISQKLNPNTEIKLPSGRSIPATILDKYIYLVKNSQGPIMSNTSASDLNNEIQKEKSSSMRRLNFTDSKDIQPTSTPKQNVQGTSYADSFKPSSNKIYKRASRVLEQYKQNSFNSQNTLQDTVIKKEEFKMPQMRPFQDVEGLKMAALQIDSVDTDMLSLSELWGERGDNTERANNIKLEEERLKREHCEVMIQQLQKKILDQQEKLAVAMKVDKAKDTAITKLKEAWLRLTNSLSRAEERHKAALDKMVQEVENFKNVADDAQNKTNHFEKELYKALDLAHDYQEKCKEINNDKLKLQEDVEKMLAVKEDCILSKEKEIETLKDNYETVMRLNKHSTEHASDVEQALEEEKKNHEETKIKLKELQNKIQLSYSEKQLAEQERDLVKEKVNEERSRCNILESQLAESQNQIGELLKRCDLLENDTKTLRHHLELQKTELRSHYQQQLEDAVRSKLQQFQQQLDAAQRDLDDAAASREAALVDGYSKQMARIEEQHKLEVSILEEKQREEIKLYRLQLAQASEKIGLLENKVDSWKKRRGEMAAQLHAVMQAQWTQALRILTRPQQAQNPQYSQFSQQSQYPQHLQYPQHSQHSHYPQHSRAQLQPATKYSQLHVDDYASDTALTGAYREEAGPSAAGRGPDDDLQRYIRELLLKKPNFEEFEPSPEGKDLSEEPTSDRPDRADRRDRVRRSLSKPPWKA